MPDDTNQNIVLNDTNVNTSVCHMIPLSHFALCYYYIHLTNYLYPDSLNRLVYVKLQMTVRMIHQIA